jgi:hypothetical protein
MRALFKKRYALKDQTAKNKAALAASKAKLAAKDTPLTRTEQIVGQLKDSGLDDDDLKRLGYKAPR